MHIYLMFIPRLNFTYSPGLPLSGQFPASLFTGLRLPKQLLSLADLPHNYLLSTAGGDDFYLRLWSEFCGGLVLIDWRELVIFSVKIGVVVTVALICYLYHWRTEEEDAAGEPPDDSPNYEPPRSLCRICFEEIETSKMFENQICSHSFCCICTVKHIETKLQERTIRIFCPEVNCKTPLDFGSCKQILPNHVRDKWDEFLCMSLIPVSQRIYCPFRDCLAMLVNDSGQIIRQSNCPACRRSICASCSAPWHSEFSCGEFTRLNAKKEGKDEEFVKELAKKKSWRRCPRCMIYVEKTEGCLHITCRCAYEFCYRCGEKWSLHMGGCISGS